MTDRLLDDLYASGRRLADDSEQYGRSLLGFGYVAYAAWEKRTGGWVDFNAAARPEYTRAHTWVERGFEAVKKTEECLSRRNLEWAFAVNHCAFVGLVANIEPKLTERFRGEVQSFIGDRPLWNYRFADTCVWHLVVPVRREWEKMEAAGKTDEGSMEAFRRELCPTLGEAQRWFDESPPAYNDPKFTQHRIELRDLGRLIGCPEHKGAAEANTSAG